MFLLSIITFLTFSNFVYGLDASHQKSSASCRVSLKRWNQRISFSKTAKELEDGEIVSVQDMRAYLSSDGKQPSGTMGAVMLVYRNGMRGVWKPNLWQSALAETGAYRVMHSIMGKRMIPPTVLRDIAPELVKYAASLPPGSLEKLKTTSGSVQFFVGGGPDLKHPKIREAFWPKVSPRDKSDRGIYYFVFGQWDRHWGNVIIDDTNAIVLIDNGTVRTRQKVRFGELPFVSRSWFRTANSQKDESPSFPFDKAVVLKNPDYEVLQGLFRDVIGQAEFDRLWKDVWSDKKDRSFAYVLWQNRLWIQSIGYANYGAIKPDVYSEDTLQAYAKLNFQNLRATLDREAFPDDAINDILDRRDMIFAAAQNSPRVP